MKKNDSELPAKRKKEIDEMFEKRAILVMSDKKVYTNEKSADLCIFLSMFTSINFNMFDLLKFELVQKSIEEDWLVKIWIDENGLFHAEDKCPKDKNWFIEVRERKKKKMIEAFGYDDDDEE